MVGEPDDHTARMASGNLVEVGHRHALVVGAAGAVRIPAGVAALPQQVDLIVAVGPVLDRVQLPGAGSDGQPLHVAVPTVWIATAPVAGSTRSTLPPSPLLCGIGPCDESPVPT